MRRVILRMRARTDAIAERWEARADSRVVMLESVRRRLEFLLAAQFGRAMAIDAADAPSMPGFFRRYVLRMAQRQEPSRALPATDGKGILLPRALGTEQGTEDAIARYRFLAWLQAERIARGTVEHFPGDASGLVRDLYLVCEGIAIDRAVSRIRGMRKPLAAARSEALAGRPRLLLLTPVEREVERMVRRGLSGASIDDTHRDEVDTSPIQSLEWAHATAVRLGQRRHYGATRPVPHWGLLLVDPAGSAPLLHDRLDWLRGPSMRIPIPGLRSYSNRESRDNAPRRHTTGEGAPSDHRVDDPRAPATWVADPAAEQGERSGSTASMSAAAPPPAQDRVPPDAVRHQDPALPFADTDRRREGVALNARAATSVQYAEWDHVTARYRERAVTVHATDAAIGDPAWVAGVFRDHAVLIRQVRQRFERLRASRTRSGQQLDGEELDIPACVRAAVDRHMGQAPDDRLYMTARTTRHPLAIVLLADISGSTRAVIAEPVRMIDIEKVALLIASDALASMGDRFALMAFAGKGPHGVRVTTLKHFSEAAGELVRHRIAALEPGGFTRLGAAVRHATAALQREAARHRLLLILSDGRPNDADEYMSDYGVEDSRQAMSEARARGVYPFCLNVDDEGSEYLTRIFGPAGYTSLRRPDQLPVALLQAVRTLIRS
jgi:nitric oxide reductase NorD protein